MTFGYKVSVWLAGVHRNQQRLKEIRSRVQMGEFGGAVGTLASLGTRGLDVQALLMQKLNLSQPPIAWHMMRDTLSEAVAFLGLVCGTIGKIALDLKMMSATEIAEVAEQYTSGRGSSSTMPQKRNPISCAYITACTTVVHQQVAAMMSSMVADFERSTGPWEVEWIVLPEVFCFTAGVLKQIHFVLDGLEIYPQARSNLDRTQGLICAEAVMMAIAPQMGREKAHERVSAICQKVSSHQASFSDLLLQDSEISKILTADQVKQLLDPTNYLGLSKQMAKNMLKI